MVYVTAGEIWYLRLILLETSPRSYEDARTYRGVTYQTFQEAALAKGLVTESNVAVSCFRVSCLLQFVPPQSCVAFFVLCYFRDFPWYMSTMTKKSSVRCWKII